MNLRLRRLRTPALLLLTVVALATTVSAQFQGGRGFRGGRGGRGSERGGFAFRGIPANPQYDGAFMFCRVMFRDASNGDGGNWSVDYPRADENLSYRFSELTRAIVSRDALGNFNHVLLQLTDAETLAKCPFIMMTEVGAAYFDEAEAAGLRTYLQKGGFLRADDFWRGFPARRGVSTAGESSKKQRACLPSRKARPDQTIERPGATVDTGLSASETQLHPDRPHRSTCGLQSVESINGHTPPRSPPAC